MKITLLHNATCPSTSETLDRLASVLEELDVDADVEQIEVDGPDLATELGFRGSPTVLVNGEDIDPSGSEAGSTPVGACRVYFRPDGRPSPLPTSGMIRDAIRRAAIGPADE